jgi:hypothetical protein
VRRILSFSARARTCGCKRAGCGVPVECPEDTPSVDADFYTLAPVADASARATDQGAMEPVLELSACTSELPERRRLRAARGHEDADHAKHFSVRGLDYRGPECTPRQVDIGS